MFALIIISCEKELESIPHVPLPKVAEFDNLKVGDIMLYYFLTGNGIHEDAYEITYTGDTLELKVVDVVDGKYLIQERITPGSAIFNADQKYIWGDIERILESSWEIREDSILVKSVDGSNQAESYLLIGKRHFSLQEITENIVEFKGWRTTLPDFTVFAEFFIEDGELLGITYPHLNGVLNYDPMAVDGNGNTYVYSKESGIVRITSISAWTGMVTGWDRMK